MRRMIHVLAMLAVAVGFTAAGAKPIDNRLIGSWRLESRIDRARDGRELVEPTLGRDPISLLIYDSAGNVSVQLMSRNRSAPLGQPSSTIDPNNSAAVGGYDAYFGKYVVDWANGTVTHILQAALNPQDVGRTYTRHFRVDGDTLTLFYDAREANGTPVTRTLLGIGRSRRADQLRRPGSSLVHGLHHLVALKALLAAFGAEARVLHAAEWRVGA
jgi:Lipocalin-like domain